MKVKITWISKDSLVFASQFEVNQIIDTEELEYCGWIKERHVNNIKSIRRLLDRIANFKEV